MELLQLRSKNNSYLNSFYSNKEKYTTYTSHLIQNELLEIVAESMKKVIVADIRNAGVYALILDETQDIACHEQVAMIIWYVNEECVIKEHFLGFFRAMRTDGETLYHVINCSW